MIVFITTAAAMLALALFLVLPPLLRRETGTAPLANAARQRWPVVLVVLAVPLLSGFLYALLGNPRGLEAPPPVQAAAVGPDQIEAMVARLAAKLKAQPADAAGWRMLARSYETLRRFELAADAYRHLLALEPENADVLVDYAVVLGMTLDSKLAGEPVRLIERALAIDANHVQALALLGSAALERGDHAGAVKPWKRIQALVPAESEMGRSIADSIAKAEAAQR
ncbi:MAG: tetratricopeptide repeat protein [Pseudomonadota bacterium]